MTYYKIKLVKKTVNFKKAQSVTPEQLQKLRKLKSID